MDWARILAHVTGTVDQELLARNEYLAAENRIIKVQLKGRLRLSGAERPRRVPQPPAVPRTATQRALDPRTFPSAISLNYKDFLQSAPSGLEETRHA
jgi:hypothetical protein